MVSHSASGGEAIRHSLFWRIARRALRLLWIVFLGLSIIAILVLGAIATTLIANAALRDLDSVMRATEKHETLPEPDLSRIKRVALFVTAQFLPLRQPGDELVVAGRVFQDCADCPEMVEVPHGYFLLGTPVFEEGRYMHLFEFPPLRQNLKFANQEGPRRLVRIPQALAFSRYEITYGQWRQAQADPEWLAITGRDPYFPDLEADYRDDQPMTIVEWRDAKAYVDYLSAKTGHTYRLPADAEWEYAARARTVTRFPWGNDVGNNNAVCVNCSSIWTERRPAPVGMHPPNGFGLYDMHGNGFEWVEDCYEAYHTSAKRDGSPNSREMCEFRTLRGGEAASSAWQSRSGYRVDPHYNNRDYGHAIRIVRELD